MPVYFGRPKLIEAAPPGFRNGSWENWRVQGLLIGIPLALLGLTISITEIVRIIYGVTNRGMTNYNSDGNNLFLQQHSSLLYPININAAQPRAEKFHYWPWTYAANLFGLVAIFAGVAGIISAFRRTYTSIFVFLALSLLSAALGAYLIAYYSVLVSYYNSNGYSSSPIRPQTLYTTWGIIGSNLAFSIAITLLGLLGFILGMVGIGGCRPKGLYLDSFQGQGPYIDPLVLTGQVVDAAF